MRPTTLDLLRPLATAFVAAIAWTAGCSAGPPAAPAPAGAPAGTSTPAKAAPEEGGMKAAAKSETVVLAGGCFWGMEEILRGIPGVVSTEVGYCGGESEHATYEQVKKGTTGHAESVLVEYDPSKLPFEELLHWFFRMHDPTTVNRQGNDRGSQYRSAIFFTTEAQRVVAERVKEETGRSGKWKSPIVTEITKAGPWSPAEDYHQDYLQKHPDGYTCHFLRD